MQAGKTADALKAIGLAVDHTLYRSSADPEDGTSARLSEVPITYDVWHFLPGRPVPRELQTMRASGRFPLLACSPIYWESLVHRAVTANNCSPSLRASMLSLRVQRALSAVFRRPIKSLPYDLYLTNSQIEIDVLRRDFQLPRRAMCAAVPNAADQIPEGLGSSPRPAREYLLYPGVFSPRKNQLGFIRAMRETPYPVVFLGGPLPTAECKRYFSLCQESAPSHWRFLGQVPHGSAEFYDALIRSRVSCLASSCETPGIALIEAAALGARPAVTREGSAAEYFGFEAEYFHPLDGEEIRAAVKRAWDRGPLSSAAELGMRQITWEATAQATLRFYQEALARRDMTNAERRS